MLCKDAGGRRRENVSAVDKATAMQLDVKGRLLTSNGSWMIGAPSRGSDCRYFSRFEAVVADA